METFKLNGQEYIQLNQLMKHLGWVGTGGEANLRIDSGEVRVNGEVEYRRRNKLKSGFTVEFGNKKVQVV
jgi:ribosome-associated protein